MSMFVIMNPDKTRIYSINPCDNAPEMRLIEKLGTEEDKCDPGFLVEFIMNETWLPQLFPRKDWANAVGEDFCGDQFIIAEMTLG